MNGRKVVSRPQASTADPWAGYYMEWLWYYVLGGSDAACGFEKPIVNSHFAWQNKKGRGEVMEVQAVSGVSGQSPIVCCTFFLHQF